MPGVRRFVLGRLLSMMAALLVISLATFMVFTLLPQDPAQLSCGRPCTAQSLALVRAYLGVDKPWFAQYLSFLQGIVAGRTFGTGVTSVGCAAPCFGYSFQQHASVASLIASRIPVTFSLAAGAAVIWLAVGVSTGVVSALRHGTAVDRTIMAGVTVGMSTPLYLLALLALLLFGFVLNVVPTGGYVPLTEDPLGWAWHLVLPWLVLASVSAAIYTRLTRNQMLDVLSEDFIRMVRARGVPERTVIIRHALRNALLPVVTVFGLDLGSLLGGAVITETVFSLPGLGQLLIQSVADLDLPVLLGCTLLAAVLIIGANFAVDVLYGVLDPRVRLS
jgi:peptide/nickel transport system permease protein